MTEHVEKTIAQIQQHIQDLEQEANDARKTVNSLCKVINKPPLYSDVDSLRSLVHAPLQGDEYYGRPQATVVREILEHRKEVGSGPATLDDLFETMIAGGFQFTGKDEDVKKRGLAIALAKNPAFHKLPNSKIGLREWYNIKDKSPGDNGGNGPKGQAALGPFEAAEELLEATTVASAKPR